MPGNGRPQAGVGPPLMHRRWTSTRSLRLDAAFGQNRNGPSVAPTISVATYCVVDPDTSSQVCSSQVFAPSRSIPPSKPVLTARVRMPSWWWDRRRHGLPARAGHVPWSVVARCSSSFDHNELPADVEPSDEGGNGQEIDEYDEQDPLLSGQLPLPVWSLDDVHDVHEGHEGHEEHDQWADEYDSVQDDEHNEHWSKRIRGVYGRSGYTMRRRIWPTSPAQGP